jgi:hypothetical protein
MITVIRDALAGTLAAGHLRMGTPLPAGNHATLSPINLQRVGLNVYVHPCATAIPRRLLLTPAVASDKHGIIQEMESAGQAIEVGGGDSGVAWWGRVPDGN